MDLGTSGRDNDGLGHNHGHKQFSKSDVARWGDVAIGQGPAGAKGPKGDKGATGPKGAAGSRGPKGDTGAGSW